MNKKCYFCDEELARMSPWDICDNHNYKIYHLESWVDYFVKLNNKDYKFILHLNEDILHILDVNGTSSLITSLILSKIPNFNPENSAHLLQRILNNKMFL